MYVQKKSGNGVNMNNATSAGLPYTVCIMNLITINLTTYEILK